MVIHDTRFNFIFFDLEETLIDTYVDMSTMTPVNSNIRFVNVESITNFIQKNNVDSANIFSFAMQNQSLVNHFDDDLHYKVSVRSKIESKFGIKINRNISLSDMIKMSSKIRHVDTISHRDYFTHYSKQQAFIDMVRYKIKYSNETDATFTLVDDMVENVIIYYPTAHVCIKLINVNTLK